MKKLLKFALLALLSPLSAHAAIQAVQGSCSVGGVKVMTSGMSSTTTVQASYPKCLVSVYATGTTNLASIFNQDGSLAANPFTANTNASWLFYGTVGTGYDITMSGGSPIPFPTPFTLVDVVPGGSGGGGGNIIPTPQFRMFLQPNTGTQAIAQGAVLGQNGVAPMLQGTINSDLYSTGNNGVSNAISSAECGSGCAVVRSQTSSETETIPNILSGQYRHVTDGEYGQAQQYFYNAGPNTPSSSGFRFPAQTDYFWNDTPQIVSRYIGHPVNTIVSGAGRYTPGLSTTVAQSDNTTMYDYTRSIGQVHASSLFALSVGDKETESGFLWYRGGSVNSADEAIKGKDEQVRELPPPVGTIVTGGANATTIKSSFTQSAGFQGDGYNLISTSEIMDSGLITAQTVGSGQLPNSITVSGTHTPSVGRAVLASACGVAQPRNAPVSQVCSISGLSGSLVTTAGSTVCFADGLTPEQALITAAAVSSVTVTIAYAHPAGVAIYQGGGCGGKLALGNGYSDPTAQNSNHNFTTYFIAGSKNTTSYDYVLVYRGSLQNLMTIPSIGPYSFSAISRASNAVSIKNPGSTYPLNNYVAPNAASIVVSGVTPSDFNGVVTGTTVNALNVTWAQNGSNESGGGGAITVTGLNNYVMYCGAETVNVPNVQLSASSGPVLDGTLQVEANNCQWPAGQAISQPNHYSTNIVVADNSMSGFTVPQGPPNKINVSGFSGAAGSGAYYNNYLVGDTLSSMLGFGGTIAPHIAMTSNDWYGNMFNFTVAPLNGGNVFVLGCPAEGCVSTAYDYTLFLNAAVGGNFKFAFSPSAGTYYMNTPFHANSVYAQNAVGVGGSAQTPPGTSAFGGYFTGVGDSGAPPDTLCLGNGTVGDCSGTLGTSNSYSANVTAGAPTPISFGIFPQGTTGSTTYTYACAVRTANGTTPSITASTAFGNATLSATNFNYVKCLGVPGGASVDIYRTVGGTTQGKIGNVPNSNGNQVDALVFKDTGLAGDGTSPPSTNTTGKLTVSGTVNVSGVATFAGETIVPTPTNTTDAATKAYVDSHVPPIASVGTNGISQPDNSTIGISGGGVLSTKGFTGTCAPTTTLTVVKGVITGCS